MNELHLRLGAPMHCRQSNSRVEKPKMSSLQLDKCHGVRPYRGRHEPKPADYAISYRLHRELGKLQKTLAIDVNIVTSLSVVDNR